MTAQNLIPDLILESLTEQKSIFVYHCYFFNRFLIAFMFFHIQRLVLYISLVYMTVASLILNR